LRIEPGLDRLAHLRGRLVALVGVLLQGVRADERQPRGHVGRQGRRRLGDQPAQGLAGGRPAIEPLLREQLPEDDPHAVQVGAAIELRPAGLLGGHVRQLPLHHPRLGGGGDVVGELGDAEVEDLHLAVVGEEQVVRADVAVDEAERVVLEIAQLVDVVQPAQRVGDDQGGDARVDDPVLGHDLLGEAVHRLPAEELHRQVDLAVGLADLEGLHHVGVLEERRQPRLGQEHRAQLRLVPRPLAHALDHAQLAKARHAGGDGEERVGHASSSEDGDQLVATEPRGFRGCSCHS
jgi:hypothetical protein